MRIEKLQIADIDKLMALQEKHIVHNLTHEQQTKQGFVTTRFTADLLIELQSEGRSFVLYDGTRLGAYAFGATNNFLRQWELCNFMIERFSELDSAKIISGDMISAENSFMYGPVCIDNDFRGRGVLKLLFEAVAAEGVGKYKFVTTFINQRNEISLAAHKKNTSLVHFDTFEFNKNTYYSLASRCGL